MKENRLQAVLDRTTRIPSIEHNVPPASPAQTSPQKSSPAQKTVLVGAHLAPEYNKQLRLLAAEEGVQINDLVREALNLLFVKKGKERIGL